MGLLLGIASGAFKIGQKLFGNIKARKEAKIEKKAEALADAKIKLATAENFFSQFTPGIVQEKDSGLLQQVKGLISQAGSQQISSAGNNLNEMKNTTGFSELSPKPSMVALQERTVTDARLGGMNPLFLLAGVAAFFLLLKKR